MLLTALEILVDKRITGMPVVDENWTLVCKFLELKFYTLCTHAMHMSQFVAHWLESPKDLDGTNLLRAQATGISSLV